MVEGGSETGKLFTGRSQEYSRSRPGYPLQILSALSGTTGFSSSSTVADIGSGTGILSRLFLDNGNTVYCVEPNKDMMSEARSALSGYSNFHPVEGTAESTSLPAHSVDLVVAGQAFHWFNPDKTKVEFQRIMKSRGYVALIWNDRVIEPGTLNYEYERICRKYSPKYHGSGSTAVGEAAIRSFFLEQPRLEIIPNHQELEMGDLIDRYFSASYAIGNDDPGYGLLKAEMREAFLKHAVDGRATLKYSTRVYTGKI